MYTSRELLVLWALIIDSVENLLIAGPFANQIEGGFKRTVVGRVGLSRRRTTLLAKPIHLCQRYIHLGKKIHKKKIAPF
jgi:hypothetical protein